MYKTPHTPNRFNNQRRPFSRDSRPQGDKPQKKAYQFDPRRKVHQLLAHVADIGGSKAYAPLVYSVPVGASPVIGDQYKNDTPLPKYPPKDVRQLESPLGCTFADTETEITARSDTKRYLARPPRSRDTSNDPVLSFLSAKTDIYLGENLISEDSILSGKPKLVVAKRSRESRDASPDDEPESAKKRVRLDYKEEVNRENPGTVKAKDVLRMVDSSLVESPVTVKEEKKTYVGGIAAMAAAQYAGSPRKNARRGMNRPQPQK